MEVRLDTTRMACRLTKLSAAVALLLLLTNTSDGQSIAVAIPNQQQTPTPIMHMNRGAARQMYGSGQLRPPGQMPLVHLRPNGTNTIHPGDRRQPPAPPQPARRIPMQPPDVLTHEVYPLQIPGTAGKTRSGSVGGRTRVRPDFYPTRLDHGFGRSRLPINHGFVPGRAYGYGIYPDHGGLRYGALPAHGIQSHDNFMHIPDDLMGEDKEYPCGGECDVNEFLCVQSCTCINISLRCNGETDCEGDEDEIECGEGVGMHHAKCEESENHVRCPISGHCISKDFLCDGDDDCGDYSDETHCGFSKNCTQDQFECNNGLCIPKNWLCDNDNDCKDFSDEMNCTKTGCAEYEFQCGDGSCISINWKCDKEPDCSDSSDEAECDTEPPTCGEGEFQCANQKCIKREFRCDRDDDCEDWSDENNCPVSGACVQGEFKCNNGRCIPERWRCDKAQDCDEGEDEAHCNKTVSRTCSPEEFTCNTGSCVLKSWVCDGSSDCPQGEDELNCQVSCDESKFTCSSSGLNETGLSLDFCINKKLVCDGQKDCPKGEDEKDCPTKKDCEKGTNCTQLCIRTADGKDGCNCIPGYSLVADGITCNDINECLYETDPVCSQTCNNTIGSFTCGCMTGYILRPDLRTCKALGAPPTLLFANRVDIRQVSLSNSKYTFILKGLHNAIALDYHYEKGLIFWSDVSTDVIRRAYINGTGAADIIKWGLESPCGVALDWIHNLLFWTDSGTRRVEVATLDGKQRVVVAANDLDKPRAIAVHPGEALVFWTDWGPSPKIERCEMDGSNRNSIITESVFWPNGLTLDYTNNRIYWADAKHNVIECSNLDGTDRKKILSRGLPHPFAITLFEDAIYWTDWHTKSISTANKATGAALRIIHSGLHFPMDIHSYHSQRQPRYKNRCAPKNGGCSHMCLPNRGRYTCVCPMGQKLQNDGRTCQKPEKLLLFARKKDLRIRQFDMITASNVEMVIPVDGIKSAVALAWDSETDSIFWTDIEKDTINKACWNGSFQQIIINSNLISPAGLAIDWVTKKLYWTDAGTVRIEVSNTDGSMRALLIWEDLDKPRDIVVDPLEGYMYWSDWGVVPKIERAGMDGSMRKAIVAQNITWPNGLAIDHELGRIYWADGNTRVIEYANLDGTGRKVLIGTDLPHPFGLDVFEDFVYWTDWETASIQSANKLTGENRETLGANITGLMDVRVFHRNRQQFKSACSDNNGNCSHLCLLRPKGYSCACPIGIKLEDDGRTCQSGPINSLIFAHRIDIRQISLDVPYIIDVVLPLPILKNAIAVDVDRKTGEIYWSDNAEDIIQKSSPDGKNISAIVLDGLEIADGIVIDSAGRKIYWTDAGRHSIEVAELDGSNRKVLIWSNLDSPRAITLYDHRGFMYWSDWGSKAQIEQAHMDGTNRKALITDNLRWPNGLAIDTEDERLYWNDGQRKVIESSDLDGKNRKIIITDVPHPYGLVVIGSMMYWTDWQTQALHRADKNIGAFRIVIRDKLEGLMDIRAIKNETVPQNVCGANNGGCSHLCLRNPKAYTCACPTGILMSDNSDKICREQPTQYLLFATRATLGRISLDTRELWDVTLPIDNVHNAIAVDFHWEKQLIFYTDVELDIIRSVNMLNFSDTKTIISKNLTTTNGLAVDWVANNIYWTDTGRKVLEVSRLDGSCRKVIINGGLDEPRAIALFPKKGYLYWTDWGETPKIERSMMDGSSRKLLISMDLGFPNGLTLDYEARRLYWADALKDKIETADLHGRNRIQLVLDATHPFGLTQFGEFIYWTDWYQKSVIKADKSTGKNSVVIRTLLDGVMEIRAVAANKQVGWNPCAVANGGCTHLCLFTQTNYTCACPDSPDDRPCKQEPKSYVPIKRPGKIDDEEDYNEVHPIYHSYNPDNDDSPSEHIESPQTRYYIIIGLMMFFVILLGVLCIVITLSQRRKKYLYGTGRSVMTFSNPNYYTSNNEVTPPSAVDKKPFLWKRLKYDKSQERVYEDKTVTNSPEIASLIPTVLTPSSSNCDTVTPEVDHSPSPTPLHRLDAITIQPVV